MARGRARGEERRGTGRGQGLTLKDLELQGEAGFVLFSGRLGSKPFLCHTPFLLCQSGLRIMFLKS